MAKVKKTDEKEEKEKILTSQDQLKMFLNQNKEDHYNFEETIDYKISSGSLKADYILGGGFGPGLHRFTGINEGGKTSEALEVLANFLENQKNSKGVYIKAEGRLSPEMISRSRLKFVFTQYEWVAGTCFVFECNIYETVVELTRTLVWKNDEKVKYGFVLDSVDGLITKGDFIKEFGEATKVAGGAVIGANLMKKMALAFQKRGHLGIFISQVRADIQLDPYSKAPVRQTSATGGNALLHYANFILEFEPRFKGDRILQNEKDDYDAIKNPYVGHLAKVTIKKSPNENIESGRGVHLA